MSQLIILNKRLIEYNVAGCIIRYALNVSSWLILVCSIFMMSQFFTVYILFELSLDYVINLDRQFVFMMPLIFSGSGYLIALCLIFPSWCSVLVDVKEFNRALESDASSDKLVQEYLNHERVCLDYLIFAKKS